MIALIGSEGSMGKRYQAIFKYSGREYLPLDVGHTPDQVIERAAQCDRILIASPTHTHIDYLRELLPTRKPILCEKPITKDLERLRETHAFCKRAGLSYNMVMQYGELNPSDSIGKWSGYNYFRHGNDGLAWDCMQTLFFANGPVELKEDSPVWECIINGERLNFSQMDSAYVAHINKWMRGDLTQSLDQIFDAHERVIKYKGLLDEPSY